MIIQISKSMYIHVNINKRGYGIMVIYVTSNHHDTSSNLVVSTYLITQILIQLNYIYKLLLNFYYYYL